MPDDKAIEHEPPMLVSLPKDVSRFDHDGLHYVTHLPSDISCVHEKLVSGFRILIEHFLPEAYPELDGDTLIELSLRPGIKREALVFWACGENLFDTLLIQNGLTGLRIGNFVHVE